MSAWNEHEPLGRRARPFQGLAVGESVVLAVELDRLDETADELDPDVVDDAVLVGLARADADYGADLDAGSFAR